jgi:parvulin-like peptidyl-prolyl isomerase
MRMGTLLLVVCGAASAADVRLVDEIIAKVNGDIITRSEIEKSKRELLAALQREGLSGARLQEAFEARSKDLLRDRIDQLLLVSKGKELNINVDGELSRMLADMQRQYKIADPEKFQQFVRENSGMSFEDFKNEYRNNMLTNRVIRQEVSSRINIKKDEIAKYYEEHKNEFLREERVFLREILVSTEKQDRAVAEKKARDLVARARKGEKFPELARDNSDALTAEQGGALPPWEKGKLRKEIEDLVWDKERGYVTDPIPVENGFLILRVDEHQKAGQALLEEVEGEIQEKLFMPRMGPEVRRYLTDLRKDAFLEIKPGWIDTSAAPGKDTTWTDPAQLRPETITKAEVAAEKRAKRVLGFIPIPGTTETKAGKSSSR